MRPGDDVAAETVWWRRLCGEAAKDRIRECKEVVSLRDAGVTKRRTGIL
jgi:hypothetical protein